MVLEVQPKDTRKFFVLFQAPEDAGYYVYGTPGNGAAQYAHPKLMTLLLAVEWQWQGIDNRKFGIGNISMADGVKFDHASHMKGLEVDIRPLRKDGAQLPVSYTDKAYDREGTETLIELLRANSPGPLQIFFNDKKIPGVYQHAKHDNHFHVQFK
jgi:penicillin-insensitive murein DD-endopeptidase